jgi:spermidine/putrescine transport system permease protein
VAVEDAPVTDPSAARPAPPTRSSGRGPHGWRARRRDLAERRRGWYPRWLWPSLALPGTLWMLVLFALPFYAMLAVGAGQVDPIFRSPVAVWNPMQWQLGAFHYGLEQLVVAHGVFREPAIRTLIYTIVATFLCLAIGYPVAYCVARHSSKRKGILLALLLAPFFISYLMRMLAWINLLQDDGMVNRFLMWAHVIGAPYGWLDGRPTTVIAGLVYGYIPYMILPLFGFLDTIDPSLLEGAKDLGASPAQAFRRVTWPLSKQGVVAGTLIVGLPILGDYYTNDLLSGSPHTTMIANQIDFLLHSQNSGPTIGAAMTFVLTLVLVIPMLFYLRIAGEGHLEDLEPP